MRPLRALRGLRIAPPAAQRALSTLGRPPAPLLFTPGPLTTTQETKAPGQRDYGSRETSFLGIVREIRAELLSLGGVSAAEGYASVIVPGSGTFGIESVIGSAVPRVGGRVLIAVNGAYGRRLGSICDALAIPHVDVVFDEREAVNTGAVMAALARERGITHVACVHHETTAGVLNPIGELGRAIRAAAPDVAFIVDSMSAFGAYPASLSADGIDFLVSSSNKCIEGVPGVSSGAAAGGGADPSWVESSELRADPPSLPRAQFSFVLCERRRLEACAGNARSLSLDLHAQWAGLEANGQFRFTPPSKCERATANVPPPHRPHPRSALYRDVPCGAPAAQARGRIREPP